MSGNESVSISDTLLSYFVVRLAYFQGIVCKNLSVVWDDTPVAIVCQSRLFGNIWSHHKVI